MVVDQSQSEVCKTETIPGLLSIQLKIASSRGRHVDAWTSSYFEWHSELETSCSLLKVQKKNKKKKQGKTRDILSWRALKKPCVRSLGFVEKVVSVVTSDFLKRSSSCIRLFSYESAYFLYLLGSTGCWSWKSVLLFIQKEFLRRSSGACKNDPRRYTVGWSFF